MKVILTPKPYHPGMDCQIVRNKKAQPPLVYITRQSTAAVQSILNSPGVRNFTLEIRTRSFPDAQGSISVNEFYTDANGAVMEAYYRGPEQQVLHFCGEGFRSVFGNAQPKKLYYRVIQ